jgi:predicted HicB family RNase H-like nuclease
MAKSKSRKPSLEELASKYTYRILWSDEDEAHIAYCLEFPSLSAHGDTQAEALNEIQSAVLGSLNWLRDEGNEAPEPLGQKKFRGEFMIRTSPEVHRRVSIEAAEQNVSLNQYVLSKIS